MAKKKTTAEAVAKDEGRVEEPEKPAETAGFGRFPGGFWVNLPRKITPVMILTTVLGAIFIAAAFAGQKLGVSKEFQSNALLSLGIAVLLAGFGSQAGIVHKGVAFAGALAAFIGVFWLLENSRKSETDIYAVGYVKNVKPGQDNVRVTVGQTTLLGSFRSGITSYSFVAFDEDLRTENDDAVVEVTISKAANEEDEGLQFKLERHCVAAWMGAGQWVGFRFDRANGVLREDKVDGKVVASLAGNEASNALPVEKCSQGPVAKRQGVFDVLGLVSGVFSPLVSVAKAGEQILSPTVVVKPERLQELLLLLESDSRAVRRAARSELSFVAPENIAALLAHANKAPASYRAQLGVSVALVEMLRRDKSLRDKITLNENEIHQLLAYATDPDRTLRVYAGEFLYDLGKPDIARLALAKAANPPSPLPEYWNNALYNLVFVSQDGFGKLNATEKRTLEPAIKTIDSGLQLAPKTRDLLKNLQ